MPDDAQDKKSTAAEIIDAVAQGEHSALAAVRKFVDTVDAAVPNVVGADEDPTRRAQIIDAAFEMVQRLLSVSNDFARDLVEVTETTLGRATGGDGGGDSD
ncbi:MAG: hypothetical protein U0U69_10000 [Acidimicrobiia bacterium]